MTDASVAQLIDSTVFSSFAIISSKGLQQYGVDGGFSCHDVAFISSLTDATGNFVCFKSIWMKENGGKVPHKIAFCVNSYDGYHYATTIEEARNIYRKLVLKGWKENKNENA